MGTAPRLVEPLGIGVHAVVENLTVISNNPEHSGSQAAFAKLDDISPVPGGQDMTRGKYRINHSIHRHHSRPSTLQCEAERQLSLQTRHPFLIELAALYPPNLDPRDCPCRAWFRTARNGRGRLLSGLQV